ncbi:hypothetical protein [Pseudomonas purpurea]|uniref:hypothetical protein n=1 Tax=Pseudomonas purpurea TaxID=3136737 RepID=UPI0032657802
MAPDVQRRDDQDGCVVLECPRQANDKTRYRGLADAQHTQARLRDRLATADLRLSVLLDTTGPALGGAVPATPPPEAWFMAPHMPDLTQRMPNELPAGLIALAVCQSYVREVVKSR